MSTLLWIQFSVRPVTVGEFVEALHSQVGALESNMLHVNTKRLELPNALHLRLLRHCGTFLVPKNQNSPFRLGLAQKTNILNLPPRHVPDACKDVFDGRHIREPSMRLARRLSSKQ